MEIATAATKITTKKPKIKLDFKNSTYANARRTIEFKCLPNMCVKILFSNN